MYRNPHDQPPRKLVVIYGDRNAAELVLKMSRRVDKYMICESVSANAPPEEIQEAIARYEGIILCEVSGKLRNDLIKYCFAQNVRAYIAPKISDIILRGAEEIRLFDTPLLLCRNYGLTFEQRLGKRIFDLVFAVVFLVLLSPLMLLSAIAIKLDDGGPVLFKQKRLTYHGKEFYVYKFRSMVVNAEKAGPQLAKENDSRITRVGRVLRKCRLDELPQLINILRGDMSVIRITYVKDVLDDDKIWEYLQSPQWTIHFKDGSVKDMDPTLSFKQPGKTIDSAI